MSHSAAGIPEDRLAEELSQGPGRLTEGSPRAEARDRQALSLPARRLLRKLGSENPRLQELLSSCESADQAKERLSAWAKEILAENPPALAYCEERDRGSPPIEALRRADYAAIRIVDYAEHGGRSFRDLTLRGATVVSDPIRFLWLAVRARCGGCRPPFFEDMLHLFEQLGDRRRPPRPTRARIESWMNRFPSGLDPEVIALRRQNQDRIARTLVTWVERRPASSPYRFPPGLSESEKLDQVKRWWSDHRFHLSFAARSPAALDELLGGMIDEDTMDTLDRAHAKGIPFFVNPYYGSLLHLSAPDALLGSEQAIRDYVFFSKELVEEFGQIVAWEKEDVVEEGRPNVAGWLLPTADNIHRRYPDVAILIPDTTGRSCAGVCSPCQRMYRHQKAGLLHYDLPALMPDETWPRKLEKLMAYFRSDAQLRDILITGGDALMSTDLHLDRVLDAVLEMARAKRRDNESRPKGEKFAEIVRVRLGTRLPVYLPQRITPELCSMLASFKARAREVGIEQFIIQTHFESPMEVTPEARQSVARLLEAGWLVTNQLVLTASASRRGHTAKLRQCLNDIGVLAYYTFTVKGYMENWRNFAPNARSVQEALEEKRLGLVPPELSLELAALSEADRDIPDRIQRLRARIRAPFLATDRTVLNLPGVGKSLSFRVIGITRWGRRVLSFDHDPTRPLSPVVQSMGRVEVIEPKPISDYIDQLEEMGEDPKDYEAAYDYSLGRTEPQSVVFRHPEPSPDIRQSLTHFFDPGGGEHP